MRKIVFGLLFGLLPLACARTPGKLANLALNKQVTYLLPETQDLQLHLLTDGDRETHPLPGSTRYPARNDFIIDLRRSTDAGAPAIDAPTGYRLNLVIIHWGNYGAPVLNPKATHPRARNKVTAHYVTTYRLLYRISDAANCPWKMLHEFRGDPIDEAGPNVLVKKKPREDKSRPWDVETWLLKLDCKNAVQLRLITVGEFRHSVCELEVSGVPE